jgi:hypothetical protein
MLRRRLVPAIWELGGSSDTGCGGHAGAQPGPMYMSEFRIVCYQGDMLRAEGPFRDITDEVAACMPGDGWPFGGGGFGSGGAAAPECPERSLGRAGPGCCNLHRDLRRNPCILSLSEALAPAGGPALQMPKDAWRKFCQVDQPLTPDRHRVSFAKQDERCILGVMGVLLTQTNEWETVAASAPPSRLGSTLRTFFVMPRPKPPDFVRVSFPDFG